MASNHGQTRPINIVFETGESLDCNLIFQPETKAQHLQRVYLSLGETTVPVDNVSQEAQASYSDILSGSTDSVGPIKLLGSSDMLRHLRSSSPGHPSVALLIPSADANGFVTRADFITYRMHGCPQVLRAESFLEPLARVTEGPAAGSSLVQILGAAVGVIFLEKDVDLRGLEHELDQRLGMPWLQPAMPHARAQKVGMVVSPTTDPGSWRSRWNAATALGVELVVMSSPEWCSLHRDSPALRNATLIPLDLNTDEGLPDRLVGAIADHGSPVDGIFTCTDDYLVSVAQAAETLGLPTPGVKCLTISTDKFLTRMFSGRDTGTTFSVPSLDELDDRLAACEAGHEQQLLFPMVCKPSSGRGSEGVFRADNAAELRDAVARILALGRDLPSGVVVEPYVDGPELDVNLVLLDGRLLFSEVVDDFPSPADYSSSAAFNETQCHAPSGLPADEQALAVEAMFNAVLLQGFRSGVFHCEARVRNSRMDYYHVDDEEKEKEGARQILPFPVLQYRKNQASHIPHDPPPSIFLHEVNSRSPGIGSSTASLHSTGVDYFALQLLAAAGDWRRFAALAVPFGHAPTGHVSLANVAVDVGSNLLIDRVGIAAARVLDEDPAGARIAIPEEAFPNPQLRERHPDLMRHVVFHTAVVRPSHWYGGDRGRWRWFMTGVVVSHESREHALGTVAAFTGAYQGMLGG
ncbi:ATP-grasp N-terminal domain [Microdochium nivale]|nr:ATP-grasp N-terminal domain [Microdochium nivale]